MRIATDKVINAVILIVIGVLQMTHAVTFTPWLILICVGVTLILDRS
jgi:hypothetical protein